MKPIQNYCNNRKESSLLSFNFIVALPVPLSIWHFTNGKNIDYSGLTEMSNVLPTNPLRIKPFNFSAQKMIHYLGMCLTGVNTVQTRCKMTVKEQIWTTYTKEPLATALLYRLEKSLMPRYPFETSNRRWWINSCQSRVKLEFQKNQIIPVIWSKVTSWIHWISMLNIIHLMTGNNFNLSLLYMNYCSQGPKV